MRARYPRVRACVKRAQAASPGEPAGMVLGARRRSASSPYASFQAIEWRYRMLPG